MARRLGIPPEELGDVKRNVIVRSLGPDPLVQVDVEGPYPLEDGDTFVLCSDGLSNQVPPEEIGADRRRPADRRGRPLPDRAREPSRRAGQHHRRSSFASGRRSDSSRGPRPGVGRQGRARRSPRASRPGAARPVADRDSAPRLRAGRAVRGLRGQRLDVRGDDLLRHGHPRHRVRRRRAVHARPASRTRPPPEEPEIPTRASIYRQYPVRIDAALVDQVDEDDAPAQGATRGPRLGGRLGGVQGLTPTRRPGGRRGRPVHRVPVPLPGPRQAGDPIQQAPAEGRGLPAEVGVGRI